MEGNLLLLLSVFFPVLAGFSVLLVDDDKNRNVCIIAFLALEVVIVVMLSVMPEQRVVLWNITSNLNVAFKTDGIAKLFACIIGIVWLLVGIYSVEYLNHEEHKKRFSFFYVVSLGALVGVALSENLMTFYLFYEFMTLITVPLVIHSGSEEAVVAGYKYMGYSIFGAGLALVGFFFLNSYTNTTAFTQGGTILAQYALTHRQLLLWVYFIMIIGLGCKAGMFPLNAWLPTAHPVAPSPASAVLSGIITKVGVLGIIRVTYYLFGVEFLRGTWVQAVLLIITIATIFMGSMLAYKEKLLKKRFAYSTISQVSYVLFGIMLMSPVGLLGALLQIVYHAIVKNCMFLCAGCIIYKTGKQYANELKGVGKQMPVVMWCLSISALSLIGIPPFGGFISKWYLAQGGLVDAQFAVLGVIGTAVLLISALLTAGYLLPIISDAFFPGNDFNYTALEKKEPSLYMTAPLVLFALCAFILGVFPNGLIDILVEISGTVFG